MAVTFHDRAHVLGVARPPHPARLTLRTITQQHNPLGLTWHWTGDGGALFHPDPIVRLRGIYDFHVERRDYGDIAYEGAFDADGNTFGLRDSRWVGAHAKSNRAIANTYTNGIVFLEDRRRWTPAAGEAWQWWVNLFHLSQRRLPQLFTHEWWHEAGGIATECPGPYITQVVVGHGGHG